MGLWILIDLIKKTILNIPSFILITWLISLCKVIYTPLAITFMQRALTFMSKLHMIYKHSANNEEKCIQDSATDFIEVNFIFTKHASATSKEKS